MRTRSDIPAYDIPDADLDLLVNYWRGTATPSERAVVEAWLQKSPERQEWYAQLHSGLRAGAWIDLSPDEITTRTAAVLRAAHVAPVLFRENPQAVTSDVLRSPALSSHVPPTRWWHRRYALPVAATLVMAIAAVFAVGTVNENRIASGFAGHVSTYTTAPGERATITLPDGTVIVLNVASQIDIPANYTAGNRLVQLRGEAMFTVTHQSGAPFQVTDGISTTRVLGTSFLVRRYATDTVSTVVVRDGRVAVHASQSSKTPSESAIVVGAAQRIVIGSKGPRLVQPADLEAFAFTRGVLSLAPTPLADAIPELNRWYDADIRLTTPSLGQQRIAGHFSAGSIAELIEQLEWGFNLRVVRHGRVLTLYPRGQ